MTEEEKWEVEFEEWWKWWGEGLNSAAKMIAHQAYFEASRRRGKEGE